LLPIPAAPAAAAAAAAAATITRRKLMLHRRQRAPAGPGHGGALLVARARARCQWPRHQGLTLVHFSAQLEPFWSHLPVFPCQIDWGKLMHPTYLMKCAYVKPRSGRV
jgi:hypothetical protein